MQLVYYRGGPNNHRLTSQEEAETRLGSPCILLPDFINLAGILDQDGMGGGWEGQIYNRQCLDGSESR